MFLDERSANLLKLLQHSSTSSMNEIEDQTGLTRRQIQYSLSKVNDWLESNHYKPVQYKREIGYFLSDNILEDEVSVRLTKRSYFFSEKDREQIFYLLILLSHEPLSLYHFQSITGISRNTVLTDLQRLKKMATQLKLTIHYSKQEGYIVTGDSRVKRFVIEQLIHEVLNGPNSQLIIDCIWEGFEEQIKAVHTKLEYLEKQLETTFTDNRLHELAYLFVSTDQLIGKGEELEEDPSWLPFIDTTEYVLVDQMIETHNFYAEWSQTEKLYATLHIVSMNRTKDGSPLKENQIFYDVLQQVTEEFERLTFVHLQEKEKLCEQLYIHFKPAYYRIKYGIPHVNPMTERICKIYPELQHLTRKSLEVLEKKMDFCIPEDEVAYFTVYFGGWLQRQGTTLDDRKKAIVVCPHGTGVSNILNYTLRELFPTILFLDVLSVRDTADYPLSYDLVFSSVYMRTDATLFVVPPILEDRDKQKLSKQVMQELYGYTVPGADVAGLMKVISKYATIQDAKQLAKELQTALSTQAVETNTHAVKEAEKPVLAELLNMHTLQLKSHVSTWQEAIELAANPLVDLGTVEERYVSAMIESIEENGPYVVITPLVAIPHARPEEGVRSLSMSLLKLEEAVDFAPDKPVRLIIVLAAADSDSHLRALIQLTNLLNEPENIQQILNATNKNQLLEIIHNYSKEETE
ncbi:BglG family transcription antiterminator [Planococcus halocryophilus]|uniref:Ascorbate-specific PTS system EIIA component n=1 Tax=Planococcus halocryophilus TaxID=1215089 RepID=A0A1C7DVL4_9BACL|nr:BglG family transcription antiterminator [Planococcus halocryophilus]ANU15348.1 transcriptional antiterminator BglG [Planococcus halocryophilus]